MTSLPPSMAHHPHQTTKANSLPANARKFEGFGVNTSNRMVVQQQHQQDLSPSCSTTPPTTPTPPGQQQTAQPASQLTFETRVLSRESLTKKERRELLKARVEALRERLRDSSSSDDNNDSNNNLNKTQQRERSRERVKNKVRERLNNTTKFPSDDAIHKTSRTLSSASTTRTVTRASRTDRFYNRKTTKDDQTTTPVTPTTPPVAHHNVLRRSERVNMTPSQPPAYVPPPQPQPQPQPQSQPPPTTNGCQQTRAPTPPPRTPPGKTTVAPPPPPTRHRPVSYAFERTSPPVYSYTDQAPPTAAPAAFAPARPPVRVASYLSDSQVGSCGGTRRTFNAVAKPWTCHNPPPIPPRRCSLHLPSPPATLTTGTTEGGTTNGNTKGLEDALLELERIYQSLRLKDDEDEDEQQVTSGSSRATGHHHFLPTSGSYDSLVSTTKQPPPKVSDDLAFRRLTRRLPPPAIPPPVPTYMTYLSASVDDVSRAPHHVSPSTTTDDMAYRHQRDQATKNVPPAQPSQFGIPLGPHHFHPQSPSGDYIRPAAEPKQRSAFVPRATPDPINDDLAIRNLVRRSDTTTGHQQHNPVVVDSQRKVFRATRSLSANLTPLVISSSDRDRNDRSGGAAADVTMNAPDRTRSMTDLAHVLNAIVTDDDEQQQHGHVTTPTTPTTPPFRGRVYRPLQQLNRSGGRLNVGTSSLLTGSVSDSDVRGKPMDETRLDELLKTLSLETTNGNHEETTVAGRSRRFEQQQQQQAAAATSVTSSSRFQPAMHVRTSTPPTSTSLLTQRKVGVNLVASSGGRALPPSNGKISPLKPVDGPSKITLVSPTKGADVFKRPTATWRTAGTVSDNNSSRGGYNVTTTAAGKATAAAAAAEESERVAKYKEERRKQLASKYGDWSSSEDITTLGEEPSYMRFSRRYRKNNNANNEDNNTATANTPIEQNKDASDDPSAQSVSHGPDPGGTESPRGHVRTNRAARLRAMATNGTTGHPETTLPSSNQLIINGDSSSSRNSAFVRTGSLRLRESASDADTNFTRTSPARRSATSFVSAVRGATLSPAADVNGNGNTAGNLRISTSQTSTTSSDVTETGPAAEDGCNTKDKSVAGRTTKDKSGKRKSNLNRSALIVEENIHPPQPPVVPVAAEDEQQRFRRSRLGSSNDEKKGVAKGNEPLRSTEIVRSTQAKLNLSDAQNWKEKMLACSDTASSRRVAATRPGAMRRPEIPEVLRHHKITPPERPVTAEANDENRELDRNTAAGRVREMTEFARATLAVDTLTFAAFQSEARSNPDLSAAKSTPAAQSHVLATESKQSEVSACLPSTTKPEASSPKTCPGKQIGQNRSIHGQHGQRAQVHEAKLVLHIREPSPPQRFLSPKKASPESDDEEYLTPTADDEKSVTPTPAAVVSMMDTKVSQTSISWMTTERSNDKPESTMPTGDDEHEPPPPISILRKRSSSDEGDKKAIHSILRKSSLSEGGEESSVSILKGQDSDEVERRPILKKRSSLEELEPRPILKKRSSTEDELTIVEDKPPPRPILKGRRKSGGEESSDISHDERPESDLPRPILKNRGSLPEDDLARPISILKSASLSLEGGLGSSKPHSILKARSLDTEEKTPPKLRSMRRDEIDDKPPLSSILRGRRGSDGGATKISVVRPTSLHLSSEQDDSDSSFITSPLLLPSILKKRPREVHPLATPHTEITNLLKGSQPAPEQRKEPVVIDLPSEGEDGPRKSVLERVVMMETKLEEEKFKVSTGQTTPRLRSLLGSPPPMLSGESTPSLFSTCSGLSDTQLLSRLEDVAQQAPRKFRRDRFSDRYRTQPITLEEVEESSSLATVQAFRRLVITRASFDAFKQREKEETDDDFLPPMLSDRKTEFPQPFRPQKTKELRDRSRRRTLPVTLEELSDARRMRSKERLQEEEEEADKDSSGEDVSRLSVAAKASLFMKMEAERTRPAPLRRVRTFRRGLQRSQTQPVTTEELHEASKIAGDEKQATQPKVVPRSTAAVVHPHSLAKLRSSGDVERLVRKAAVAGSSDSSEDDPCQLSLADRVRMFDRKVMEERMPASDKPPIGYRRRGNPSRYKTQPVTTEEVEKARTLKTTTTSSPPTVVEHHEEQEGGNNEVKATATTTNTTSESSSLTSSPTEDDDVQAELTTVQSQKAGDATAFVELASFKKELCQLESSARTLVQMQEELSSRTCSSSLAMTATVTTTTSTRQQQVVTTSNDEDSSCTHSSGGRERRIKNEAINRRRNAQLRRMEDRRSLAITHESTNEHRRMQPVHQRSQTEPNVSALAGERDTANGGAEKEQKSIQERLEELKKSGEEGWRKRLENRKDETETENSTTRHSPPTTSDQQQQQQQQQLEVDSELSNAAKVRLRRRSREERPSSIGDRISQLEFAQKGWKGRVSGKDSRNFTVAGKMGVDEPAYESPAAGGNSGEKVRRTPRASVFKGRTSSMRENEQTEEGVASSAAATPPLVATVKRSQSMPTKAWPGLSNNSSNSSESDSLPTPPTTVCVPTADDDEFRNFFGSVSSSHTESERVEISEGGFEEVVSTTHELLVQKRSVRMQQRRTASSRNPLKVLATRTDLQHEYTEVKSGVVEKEMRRINVEKIAKSTSKDLALSALAGLASKEDFKAVELRKSASTTNAQLLPFRDLMLLQVKGRRHVQTRLVEPCVGSINHGDNYILVTPTQVYNWIGEFSNVIERSRAAEVAATIQSKKDLGCTNAAQVITIDEEKKTGLTHVRKFFQLLGGSEADVKAAGNPKEDEDYENAIIGTNMVYTVDCDHLAPLEACWGSVPRIEMLDPLKVLVFDFGSEMYVWHGKKATTELRKTGISLARELWERGYDYSECDINPLHPVVEDELQPRVDSHRPPWAVFAKMNQHMETVLFREKFLDWPDMSRIIKVKRKDSDEKLEQSAPLCACDAKKMLDAKPAEPDLVIEGSHVGRGVQYWDEAERRSHEIATRGIKVWHILEYSHRLLPRESWGQFHSGDTYVVRWQYVITVGGRDLSGRISRHSFAGRERCAYFFWQGSDSTINEKGASALMTVELDEEKGPHVRVVQGREPPCFLNLFDGTMVVHQGKREVSETERRRSNSRSPSDSDEDETKKDKTGVENGTTVSSVTVPFKLYMIRGEVESELCLVEIQPTMAALRSRGVLILVSLQSGDVYVWYGSLAPQHTQTVALTAAENLKDRRPLEVKIDPSAMLTLKEIHEGQEPSDFLLGFGEGSVGSYASVGCLPVDATPRLFSMSSVSGVFEATEVLCPYRCTQFLCPMPFLQADLYNVQQPALFLLDAGRCVFLWLGWWPEATDDNENTATGSAKVRWDTDRRCAMETTISYCKEKSSTSPPPAYVVSAGLEPLNFTNLFPEWEYREDVATLNVQDGRRHGDQLLVQDVLLQLNRSQYTLAELQSQPLPEGVDPSRLESYLDCDNFQVALGMSKDEFYQLPAWKQSDQRKKAGLF